MKEKRRKKEQGHIENQEMGMERRAGKAERGQGKLMSDIKNLKRPK